MFSLLYNKDNKLRVNNKMRDIWFDMSKLPSRQLLLMIMAGCSYKVLGVCVNSAGVLLLALENAFNHTKIEAKEVKINAN